MYAIGYCNLAWSRLLLSLVLMLPCKICVLTKEFLNLYQAPSEADLGHIRVSLAPVVFVYLLSRHEQ